MADILQPHLRDRLVALLRAAYPHDSFPDGPYERTADEVVRQASESTWNTNNLRAGLESLDVHADGDFTALDPQTAEEILRGIENAAFFQFIRGVTVVALYDDHEVWDLLGYEGASFDQGGYLNRGFNDLDWLPDPRVTEYDGPDQLIPVAEHDQPKGTNA